MTLLKHFPKNYTPRPSQIDILNNIETALKQKEKYIIVQAPTGCGKSHIVATLAQYSKDINKEFISLVESNKLFERADDRYTHEKEIEQHKGGSYVLTTTKHLQNQYEAIFNDVHLLKGKQNYKCNLDETFSVNVAPCVLTPKLAETCIAKKFCTYYNKLNTILLNKFRTTNYNKYLTLPSIGKHCDILICDEASELEDVIVEYYSITLNYKKLAHLELKNVSPLTTESSPTVKKWLNQIKNSAIASYEKISDDIKNNIHSMNYTQGEVGRLNSLKNIIDQIDIVLSNWTFCKYIVIKNNDNITVTPLQVKDLTEKIFSYANTVIFLSSTIYDVQCFARTLGIPTYKYIEQPGVFDSKKSPIYAPCKVSLNHSNLSSLLPTVLKQIKDICDMYPKSKGLIHTHTNAITQAIQKKITDKRFLFKTDVFTNEHILYEHRGSSDATVLVSPSLVFGVDLPDDLCRFQIIVKLPYPSLGDKRISTLAKEDPSWYESKMFTKLIQMCGRGTRNEFDYCDTFVLDGNFIRATTNNWGKLPLFYRDRLK